jgi:signal peptidase I
LVTAAACILTATLFLPVLKIYGASMTPSLQEGDIVLACKTDNLSRGDVAALYYSNRILVKRVVGLPFEWVDMDEEGCIYINGERLEEDYVQNLEYGEETNVVFPYQVPEGSYFVVGDSRQTSVDSRNTTIGAISQDDIIGRLIWKVWPLNRFGSVQ